MDERDDAGSRYAVDWVSRSRVLLPPALEKMDQFDPRFDVYVFKPEIAQAASQTARRVDSLTDGLACFEVALIPRPDTPEFVSSVSVAGVVELGGDANQRHFGYIDHSVDEDDRNLFYDLARYSGGEVSAYLYYVPDTRTAWLALPSFGVLRASIAAFFKSPTTPPIASRPILHPSVELDPKSFEKRESQIAWQDLAVEEIVRDVQSFDRAVQPVGAVILKTVAIRGRVIEIKNGNDLSHLGTVYRGVLQVADERQRDAVSSRLLREGIALNMPPKWTQMLSDEERIFNIESNRFGSYIWFRPDKESTYRYIWFRGFAVLNLETLALYVIHEDLVSTSQLRAARLGFEVGDVHVSEPRWLPTDDFPDQDLSRTAQHRSVYSYRWDWEEWTPNFLSQLRGVVPREIGVSSALSWSAATSDEQVDDSDLLAHERFADHSPSELGFLIEPTGLAAACRLCGYRTTQWRIAQTVDPVAYCPGCVGAAVNGVLQVSRDAILAAFRRLVDLEYDGIHALKSQLKTPGFRPDSTVAPTVLDETMLLRMVIPRNIAWTELILDARLAPKGIRRSRGTVIRARDGHLCHSLQERAVCDFLHQHEISHKREPLYPSDLELNPNGLRRADWLMDDGTFVEMWGLLDDDSYATKAAEKRLLAFRNGITLIELTVKELSVLPVMFRDFLPEGIGSETQWSWSPVVPVDESMTEIRSPGNPNRNGLARGERIERCQEAVRLQREGFPRSVIADSLGVSLHSVQELLRDGKFYENPQGDSARFSRVREADVALTLGATSRKVSSILQTSHKHAREICRDARILRLIAAEKETE